MTRQPRPGQRNLPLLDPLLGGALLTVETDYTMGLPVQVRDDESDPGKKLADVPLDFGNDSARVAPTFGLISRSGGTRPWV